MTVAQYKKAMSEPTSMEAGGVIIYLKGLVLLCYKLRMSMGIALRGGIVKLG